jgi:glycosidase
MVFDFDLANAIITTVAMGDAQALNASIASEVDLYNYRGMGTFLTNHDMNRVMSQLGNDLNLMKHAATVLLTIPGTPFLYYGEEIGMVGMKPDEQIRTPMQWSPDNNGGFTTGKPWEVINYSFKEVNVLSQVRDEDSLLSLYRKLINLRLKHNALLDGVYEKVDTSNPALYAGIRAMDDDVVLTIVNLKASIIENPVFKFKGDLPLGKYKVKILIGNEEVDSLVEIVRNGEYLEFSFLKPIAPHQNIVLQLILDK